MGWLGWIAGCLVGRLIGPGCGIVGGILGAVLEEYIKGQSNGNSGEQARMQAQNEAVFLASLGAMLGKMAKLDGRVTQDEIDYCAQVFARLGFEGDKLTLLIKSFNKSKDDQYSIYDYAASFAELVNSEESRTIIYDILWDLAQADGAFNRAELEALKNLPRFLNIDQGLYDWNYRRRVQNQRGGGYSGSGGYQDGYQSQDNLEEAYRILGTTKSATEEQLKSAYRDRAKRLHPDRLRAQGLSEELLSKANAEMARLNEAWEKIKAARNIK